MNPITNTKNQNLMNLRELNLGYTGTASSWHRQYKDSAWIFIGGLNFDLTEGDVICVFSQYGEVVNINLVRDKKTGVSKGFAFLCYEDQRSTVLATDNLNGIKLAGRTIRVDHVEKYKVPTEGTVNVGAEKRRKAIALNDIDVVSAFVREHGCGPDVMKQVKKIESAAVRLNEIPRETRPDSNPRSSINGTSTTAYSSRFRNPSPSGDLRSSLTSDIKNSDSQRMRSSPSPISRRKNRMSPIKPQRRRRSPMSRNTKRTSPLSPPRLHASGLSDLSPPRKHKRRSRSPTRMKQESPDFSRVRR